MVKRALASTQIAPTRKMLTLAEITTIRLANNSERYKWSVTGFPSNCIVDRSVIHPYACAKCCAIRYRTALTPLAAQIRKRLRQSFSSQNRAIA